MSEPTPVNLDLDPDLHKIQSLITQIRAEADSLEAVLPAAIEAQWTAPPRVRPESDTSKRSKGIYGDPTASIALNEERFALRDQVIRSDSILRSTLVALRGVRRGLELRLASWGAST